MIRAMIKILDEVNPDMTHDEINEVVEGIAETFTKELKPEIKEFAYKAKIIATSNKYAGALEYFNLLISKALVDAAPKADRNV